VTGNAWIGELIAAIFYLWVGIRLARLASRTREPPERLLSGMFFFSGVSYLLYTIPLAIPIEALWLPFNFAGRVAYIPAPIFVAVFTREVFRSESRWSALIVYATAILLVVGVAASAMMGDWEGFSLDNPFFWFEWLGYTLPFAWAGLEALVQYYRALRRQRLGLCDRMVCNRLLLWGYFGIAQLVISFVLLRMYADFEANNAFSGFFDGLTGALEILAIALVWLVFFPPRFYRKRIAGSDGGAASAEEV
jgi:hypothetical protein